MSAALVAPALTLAFPIAQRSLKELSNAPDETSKAFVALARGDTGKARLGLTGLRRLTAGRVSGTSVDGNFRCVLLSLALGDTLGALADLDPVLRAPPTLGPNLLSQITQATSLVRALALRAELASRGHDRSTASLCARAVVDLWLHADPQLQSVVDRMKRLAE